VSLKLLLRIPHLVLEIVVAFLSLNESLLSGIRVPWSLLYFFLYQHPDIMQIYECDEGLEFEVLIVT